MFSNRFHWDLSANALSRLLTEKRARGDKIYDLTESNPTRVGLDHNAAEILAALSQPHAMLYEPNPSGHYRARRAVAQYYRNLEVKIDPSAVFLTAGTSEAYGALFKLLADPGDEILIPSPGYPLLSYLAGFDNLKPFTYPQRYEGKRGWFIDLDVLSALITAKTRAVVVVNPNNPTGAYLKPDELAFLDTICRKNELALIVDEVFSDFGSQAATGRVATALNQGEALTLVLNGLSKMVALPQVKLAWIAVSGNRQLVQACGRRLEMLLDFYLSVGTPVQHAAQRLLDLRKPIQTQILARLAENSRFLEEQAARTANCRPLLREGGWYAVLEISDALSDEERVLRLLEKENTLVHPGFFYDFNREGYVVISLLPDPQVFQTGIRRLIERFGR